MWICKHCQQLFDQLTNSAKANHTRWCDNNPKRLLYQNNSLKAIAAMNQIKRQKGFTNQYSKARLQGTPIPRGAAKGKPGSFTGKNHSKETKDKISAAQRAYFHRRMKKNPIEYKGVLLDSSWELELAKRLDDLGIEWIRPDPIKWIDTNGFERNYFPDFYLKDYDVYLDPKNPHAVKVQNEKINCILNQHNNVVIIRTLNECKNFQPSHIYKTRP